MKGLITWVMKGRMQAIMAIVVSAVLAVQLTPLALISSAIVVLATLRNGPREGLLVVVSATLAIAGLGGLLFSMPMGFALLGLILWLPGWGLGSVYGRTGSLARTLEAAAGGAMVLILAQYLLLDDPAAYWLKQLQPLLADQLDPSVIPPQDQEQMLAMLAAWMPGGLGSGWLMSTVLAVMLARWAHAVLDRPGGFGEEFRSMCLSRIWLLALPLLMVPTFLLQQEQPGLLAQLYLVGMTLFLFQGFSVAHSLLRALGGKTGWFVGLYALMLIGLPYSLTAIAVAGYADGWLNFRAKVQARPKDSQGPDQ